MATYDHWIPCWLSHRRPHCEQWRPCIRLSEHGGPARRQKHLHADYQADPVWCKHLASISRQTSAEGGGVREKAPQDIMRPDPHNKWRIFASDSQAANGGGSSRTVTEPRGRQRFTPWMETSCVWKGRAVSYSACGLLAMAQIHQFHAAGHPQTLALQVNHFQFKDD